MTKPCRISTSIDKNGNVFEKRRVRHRDGKISVKRTLIACGIPGLQPVPAFVGVKAPDRRPPAPVASLSSVKRARKSQVAPAPTARRPTITERTHHEWDGVTAAYVKTTNRVGKWLRDAKAPLGSHIDDFQKDFETVSGALRSVDLDRVPTGSGTKIPISQVQAQDRLKVFERRHQESYLICRLLIIDQIAPKDLPISATERKKVGIRKIIQGAVDDLASFYTPERTRADRRLIAFAKEIEDQRRRAEINGRL